MENQVRKEEVMISSSPTGDVQSKTTVVSTQEPPNEFFVSKTNQVIFAIVGIIDLLLLLRILFLLLGANQVGIVNFIIKFTDVFLIPFVGIFKSPSTGDSYLDVAALVAILVYGLFAFILSMIVNLFSKRTE